MSAASPPPSRAKRGARLPGPLLALVLLVVPLVALGPALLPGARLLPQLPAGSPPLATEDPAGAAAALDGSNFSTADRLFPFLTDQREARSQVRTGTLPTWDPNLGLGVPLFAASIAALAYPPNWLALALPPDLAAAPLALLSLFLAGLGMALFLRKRGLVEPAVLVGALAMQASTWGLANLHYFMKVDAALWLPWMLLGIEGIAGATRRERRRGAVTLALAVGLSLLASFPPITVFALATAGLYALARLVVPAALGDDGPRRPLGLLQALGAVVLGLGIGAWQVLPMVEASELSRRVPRSAETMVGEALPASTSAGLLVPDLFGTADVPLFDAATNPIAAWLTGPGDGARLLAHNELEWNTHLGGLALLLALVALATGLRRAWLPGLLVALWLGFAQAWPGLRELYHVPGLNLGAPSRALAMAWPLMAWLAALGAQALVLGSAARSERTGRRRPGGPGATACVLCGGFALLVTLWFTADLDAPAMVPQLAEAAAAGHDLTPEEALAQLGEANVLAELRRLAAALGGPLASSLLLTVAGLLAVTIGRRRARLGLPMAAALGLALGLVPRAATGALEAPAPEVIVLACGGALVLALGLAWCARREADEPAAGSPLLAARGAAALGLLLSIGMVAEALDVAPRHLAPRHPAPLVPASPAMDAVAAAAAPARAGDSAEAGGPIDGRVLRLIPGGANEAVSLARPNLPSLYGVKDLTPYMVFTPRTLVELVEALDPAATYRSGIAGVTEPTALTAPILDALRTSAILSVRPAPADPRLEPLHAAPGFHVTRRAGALPPAWLAHAGQVAADDAEALDLVTAPDFAPRELVVLAPGSLAPAESRRATAGSAPARLPVQLPAEAQDRVRWSRPSASRLDVSVTTTGGAWLVMGEQFYPGWKANLDGRDVDLLRANHALRALWIPPGEHLLRTWYEPWSLRTGASLALFSLAFLVGIGLGGWLADRRRAREVAS